MYQWHVKIMFTLFYKNKDERDWIKIVEIYRLNFESWYKNKETKNEQLLCLNIISFKI